ncbi:hypothetical protein C8J57DRAFT_1533146 [Mycena rebaudengoi]|nr:hypothetical protein C8J57DRAFT_1533146 [Mycena rebaudengoi]
MVLKILAAEAAYFPSEYTVHFATALAAAVAARATRTAAQPASRIYMSTLVEALIRCTGVDLMRSTTAGAVRSRRSAVYSGVLQALFLRARRRADDVPTDHSATTTPVERDIRILNVVNRFYAATAAPPVLFSSICSFSPSNPLPPPHLALPPRRRARSRTTSSASLTPCPPPRPAHRLSLNAIPVAYWVPSSTFTLGILV